MNHFNKSGVRPIQGNYKPLLKELKRSREDTFADHGLKGLT